MNIKSFFYIILLFLVGCTKNSSPKPNAFLALEYPMAQYDSIDRNCSYVFEKNTLSQVIPAKGANPCWINLQYNHMHATIFITYEPVGNNLDSLLRDAQKLPLQHTVKADYIEGDQYKNPEHNTYGMFYEITGNAASQAQFYLTDSVKHFLTGSVYFRVQPNYDSILPAASYLKKDVKHLMESLSWRDYK